MRDRSERDRVGRSLIPAWAAVFVCVLLLAGCTAGGRKADGGVIPQAKRDFFAMDTVMAVSCYGEQAESAAAAVEEEIYRLDHLLGISGADSDVVRVNAAGSGMVSAETAEIVSRAMEIADITGGAFDITVFPLVALWGFPTGSPAVPADEDIKALLPYIGSGRLTMEPETRLLTLGENQGIDLGGIAKGYASSRATEILKEYGITSGIVSLGGNVQCLGTKPDGSPWRCAIEDPDKENSAEEYLGILSVSDKAVVTSGGYERYFDDQETGRRYHHIIDPATGYPAESGLVSATCVSADGTLADALSTALYCMGAEKGVCFWQEYGEAYGFDIILETEDGTLYVSAPIAEAFSTKYDVIVCR